MKLSKRLDILSRQLAEEEEISPDNIFIVLADDIDEGIGIAMVHNTSLQGIVEPSIHDDDTSDLDFMKRAAVEQRVSLSTIAAALTNKNNIHLPRD